MNYKLQPHQEDAVNKLDEAILLYHGLGSGKTLTSIAATKDSEKVTVVTPASLRENYKKEISKFTPENIGKYNVISYEGALKDKESFGDALVVDEIHRIANSSSERSKKIMDMAKDYKTRIGLSGTPVVNKPSDIAPIARFLLPLDKNIPLSNTEFNNKFIGYKKEKLPLISRLLGYKPGVKPYIKNEEAIKKVFDGRVHYNEMQSDEYPDVIEEIVKVPMSKGQTDVYNTVTNSADPIIAYKVKKNIPLTKTEMRNVNAFMSAARVTSNYTGGKFGHDAIQTPKMDKVIDDFVEESEKNKDFKGLIYSNYLSGGLDLIAARLKDKGIEHESFTGKMNDKQKAEAVRKFNNNETKALLVSSAGAEGIDLKGTNMVQIVEPHWNKAKIDQVIGRAARFKSHSHLPEEQRKVKVKKYQSITPDRWYKPSSTSSDEYLEQMSLDKDSLNQTFLKLLKGND